MDTVYENNSIKYRLYQQYVLDPTKYETIIFNEKKRYMTYEGTLPQDDDQRMLEKIFVIFNMDNRPTRTFSSSLSVGDIVWINEKYYQCMPIGFKEVTLDM